METTVYDSNNPVVDYAEYNLWGNPEENSQFQVKLVRISSDYGESMNYNFMGKWRILPRSGPFFHVFSVGGLHPGFWNFKTSLMNRNPLDRWVNLSAVCKTRGVQLDIYNTQGMQYPRSHAWVMVTYDGLVLLAFQKLNSYPMPITKDMFFRCYTPSIPVDFGPASVGDAGNPFVYETLTYENSSELNAFNSRYALWRSKPGFTGVFRNGAYFDGPPSAIPSLTIGEIVEFWHDPTVIRAERYNYKDLKNFQSDLDKKRKLILHPPKRVGDFTLRYFDDNDYYLIGPKGNGVYLHRNDESTIRQLTHADVSVADDAIQMASEYHPDLKKVSEIKILVLIRQTDWEPEWPNDHQRIRYLYRFNDTDILKAMSGERATVPEWTGGGLESGAVMSLTRSQLSGVRRVEASAALGYNATTRVVSETPLKVAFVEGGRGVEVPNTYRRSFTAWEYDAQGQLLGNVNQANTRYYNPSNHLCELVEFTFGRSGRQLDYVITKDDHQLDAEYDHRIYTSKWDVNKLTLIGELTDVTGDDKVYTLVNGKIVWKTLDRINERGVILSNSASLGYSFQLDHIDHSLAFALTVIYENGGLIFPTALAQVDVWLNGHPLVDGVDWIFKDQYCYIVNKEFIVPGAQSVTVRAHGFSADQENPKFETELGFVDGGVIGRFGRYNLRADRVTRTVINGALYVTDDVPSAEDQVPVDLWDHLNGKPYMVKHVYCPIKFVEPYRTYPGYELSREVDLRVTDYMSKYLAKPDGPDAVIPNLQDKYRVFSPFMNVLVNGLINRLIKLPVLTAPTSMFSEQVIRDLVSPYLWWLPFDPVTLKYDRRYFAIMPFANVGKLTMTSSELLFLKQVNDSYLDSVCAIEGHFEVNNNAR